VSVAAKDARVGAYYRLTRDPGQSYYMISRPGAVAKLEKRLVGRDPRLLKPDELRLAKALALCRDKEHVLALRGMRYLDDHGNRREARAYVAFPPDYQLREVARPPGYTAAASKRKSGGRPLAEEGTDDDAEENDRQEAG